VLRRALLAGLVLAFVAGCGRPTAPRIHVDDRQPGRLLFCSPVYVVWVPIGNLGDATLHITSVRTTCQSCSFGAIDRDTLEPGEKTSLQIQGKHKPEGEFEITGYIESDDPANPVTQVRIPAEHRRQYSLNIGWQGDEKQVGFPFETEVYLPARTAGEALTVEIVITPLHGKSVESVKVDSDILRSAALRLEGRTASVYLEPLAKTPGIRKELVRFVINERDILMVPVQLILLGACAPEKPAISFSHVRRGSVVYRECTLLFGDTESVWEQFSLELPEEDEPALAIEDCRVDGKRVTLEMKIDTRFLDGVGFKTIPVVIVGDEHRDRAYVTFYGNVY